MGFILTTVCVLLLLFGITRIPGKLIFEGRRGEERTISLRITKLLAVTLIMLIYLFLSFTFVVSPGKGKVGVLFGSVQPTTYQSGFHLKNPLLRFAEFDLRRQSLDFNSTGDPNTHEDDVLAMSSNELPMSIDTTFGYQYNPKWLPWIVNNLYDVRGTLLMPASRSAVRSAAANFSAVDASVKQRQAFETSLQNEFENAVIEGLIGQGLTAEQAKEVFIFLPVQLRKVLPPQNVLDAITQEEAAMRLVGVEQRMTTVMEERANRLTQVGVGYANAMREIPEGITVKEASAFIEALALREAVDKDKVNVVVMSGDSTPAFSVKQ
jgi:regulator of protease activity HflC (stomatin/prohibitin superfamily)